MGINKALECTTCQGAGFKYKKQSKEFLTCPVCKGSGFIIKGSVFQPRNIATTSGIGIQARNAATTPSKMAHEYIEVGRKHFREEKYDAAISYYQKAISFIIILVWLTRRRDKLIKLKKLIKHQ
ncbi:MAG: hypothetical protein ACXAEU_09450 [Candidatus Hodarchaeales archaeon]|jgi:hypothetical protein